MKTRSKAFMDNGNLCIVIPNPSNSLKNHLKNLLNYEIISNLEADPVENFNPNKEQEEIENRVNYIKDNLNTFTEEVIHNFRELTKILNKKDLYIDRILEKKMKEVVYQYLRLFFSKDDPNIFLDRTKKNNMLDDFFVVFGKFIPINIIQNNGLASNIDFINDLDSDMKEKIILETAIFYNERGQNKWLKILFVIY